MNNKYTFLLLALLLFFLSIIYKGFFSEPLVDSVDVNVATKNNLETLIRTMDQISFDTSFISDPKFNSLKSIESPLISVPVGKVNPFFGVLGN